MSRHIKEESSTKDYIESSDTIVGLQNDIRLYDDRIEKNKNDSSAYYLKGVSLVELAREQRNKENLKDALKCYDTAIEISGQEAKYFIERSKLYVMLGKVDKAIEDIKKIDTLPKREGIEGKYIENAIDNIAKLQLVQESITNLVSSKKIDDTFAKSLQDHINVTAGLVVQVGVHNEKLNNHDNFINKLNSDVENISKIVHNLEKDGVISTIDITEIRTKIEEADKIQKQIHKDILDSGMSTLAEVKRDLVKLRNDKNMQKEFKYCQAFYWNITNLINAYAVISTGTIDGHEEEKDKKAIEIMLDTAVDAAVEGAKSIPFLGVLISTVDKIIRAIYKKVKANEFEDKCNIVNKVIQSKYLTYDQIAVDIAKLSLNITKARGDSIKKAEDKVDRNLMTGTLADPTTWEKIKARFKKVKEYFKKHPAFNPTKLYNESDDVVKLALQDVALFMCFLLKSDETWRSSSSPLSSEILTESDTKKLDSILDAAK